MSQEQQMAPYEKVLGPNENLILFMDQLRKFNDAFSAEMVSGSDFTLTLEVRGCNGKFIHARVNNNSFKRPPGQASA